MVWAIREYSRQEINSAGSALLEESIAEDEYEHALTVANNWRSAHAFPLNTFQTYLRSKTRDVNVHGIVTQRIKRLPAIRLKLQQQESMKLGQMQDIGGCRAVAGDILGVNRLKNQYNKNEFKHKLVNEKNYIETPRDSGYRGIHQIYQYRGSTSRTRAYNDLKIEVQLRSWLQHAWATAVEIVGMFREEPLKSGLGDERWLRFFKLMGSVFALREKTPLVSGTPENRNDLLEELRFCADSLDVIKHFEAYRKITHTISSPGHVGDYYLLELIPREYRLKIQHYNKKDVNVASSEYFKSERQGKQGLFDFDTVLVSVDSSNMLQKAYWNYFADVSRFTREVKMALETGLSPNFYPGPS